MCTTRPDVPNPTRYQESRAPTYRSGGSQPSSSRGRRGTILTRNAPAGDGAMDSTIQNKKTLLGS